MIDYSNESIQFDCFRGGSVTTDEASGEVDIRYRQGCCKLEVYDTLKGIAQEQYNDYLGTDIDRYYHEKEALEENQNFVQINHKETLAQIFTDIRYTRKDNEAMSRTLIETLVRQDFLPYTIMKARL